MDYACATYHTSGDVEHTQKHFLWENLENVTYNVDFLGYWFTNLVKNNGLTQINHNGSWIIDTGVHSGTVMQAR